MVTMEKVNIDSHMKKIIVDGYKCERCGHEWRPRAFAKSKEDPIICPKCKSPYWDKPRRNKK